MNFVCNNYVIKKLIFSKRSSCSLKIITAFFNIIKNRSPPVIFLIDDRRNLDEKVKRTIISIRKN